MTASLGDSGKATWKRGDTMEAVPVRLGTSAAVTDRKGKKGSRGRRPCHTLISEGWPPKQEISVKGTRFTLSQ